VALVEAPEVRGVGALQQLRVGALGHPHILLYGRNAEL
jgi:hypothetical protein